MHSLVGGPIPHRVSRIARLRQLHRLTHDVRRAYCHRFTSTPKDAKRCRRLCPIDVTESKYEIVSFFTYVSTRPGCL